METLKAFGNSIIEPASGELASGLSGKGRMAEPEEIVNEIVNFFTKKKTISR
jgi:phosphopantothenoylcysteine decarboxylase/phosphopantothenate--cysteine ligase